MQRHIGPDEFVTVTIVTGRHHPDPICTPEGPPIFWLRSSGCGTCSKTRPSPSWSAGPYRIVGLFRVYALRVTYIGELGWELVIVPSLHAVQIYDLLGAIARAKEHGLRNGWDATLVLAPLGESLSRFRVSYVGPIPTNPIEAGLGFG